MKVGLQMQNDKKLIELFQPCLSQQFGNCSVWWKWVIRCSWQNSWYSSGLWWKTEETKTKCGQSFAKGKLPILCVFYILTCIWVLHSKCWSKYAFSKKGKKSKKFDSKFSKEWVFKFAPERWPSVLLPEKPFQWWKHIFTGKLKIFAFKFC